MTVSPHDSSKQLASDELCEAKAAIAIGAGVGVIGTVSAVLIGATCPICMVMAPALIGTGLLKGYSAKKRLNSQK